MSCGFYLYEMHLNAHRSKTGTWLDEGSKEAGHVFAWQEFQKIQKILSDVQLDSGGLEERKVRATLLPCCCDNREFWGCLGYFGGGSNPPQNRPNDIHAQNTWLKRMDHLQIMIHSLELCAEAGKHLRHVGPQEKELDIPDVPSYYIYLTPHIYVKSQHHATQSLRLSGSVYLKFNFGVFTKWQDMFSALQLNYTS